MAGSVNKVTLVGNLGRDPEVRKMQSGQPVVTLSVATSERWRDKSTNENRERTEWHRVVIFNEHLAKIAEQYLRKGSQVYVEGSLQTRKWTDKEGLERYTTEVVIQRFRGELTLLGGRGEGSGNDGYETDQVGGFEDSGHQQGSSEGSGHQQGRSDFSRDLDDDVPF